MSDNVPLTPPRRSSSSSSNKKHSTFTTPNQYAALLTPATSAKKPKSFGNAISSGNKLSVITPNTPQKSPSKSGSQRKRNFNDIFNDSSSLHQSSEKLPMGLFLPSPRIVGSGRNGKHLPSPAAVNRNEIREPEAPMTPGKQVITEEMVKQWQESSDDEEGVEVTTWEQVEKIPKANLPNPFIASGADHKTKEMRSDSTNPFLDKENASRDKIDYNTHMELVNNKTGERKVVKLTKNQMKIKPKKLSFEGL
ncbi:hypothetical protein KGF57_000185 [Candida theae]|uniref:Uncharacterized protein n=1 Tax=Candida theae TaxID=1198502 RepID=A0AAD5G189_9ASCO|nr:uncharacterized protein KGF57_000185 [Candida theae]KAI5968491.1 hypothetical protein KGF57_000185 [Candida theae]